MLERTSGLLADLTDCTAMVVGPSHESAAIRSVQLVGLGPRLALLVVVLADGAVQKQSMELAEEVDEAVLSDAAARLAAHSLGVPLTQVGPVAAAHRRSRPPTPWWPPAVAALRSLGSAERGGPALRRGFVPDGGGLRRRGDGAVGAEHPRTAAGGGHPAPRHPRHRAVGGHRHRARDGAAGLVRHRGHAGVGGRDGGAAPSACSARPG